MVTQIDEIKGKMDIPIVKLDKSQREVRVLINHLRLKTDHDRDMQKFIEMGTKLGNDINAKGENYKVGEMILYNGNKTYGYIIQVMDDFVKIVSD